jgi:hypothetical protein
MKRTAAAVANSGSSSCGPSAPDSSQTSSNITCPPGLSPKSVSESESGTYSAVCGTQPFNYNNDDGTLTCTSTGDSSDYFMFNT